MNMFSKVFGTRSQREVKRIMPLVEKIESLRPDMQKLSDEELRGKTREFKKRLEEGETLDDLLPEAFAVVREAGKRVLGMEHFRVQLIGGIILHQGRIAEMRTGEGKTLVATLPSYLNALEGKGVHVVTVNDYLAKRDAEEMGKIHEFLGLTVGVVLNDMKQDERRAAYNCDVTYVTNNELGFDYLRDNMVIYKEQLVQRDLHYCIIDEVDSILIDEARTPLIISGQSGKSTKLYEACDILAQQLERGEASHEMTKMAAIMGEEVIETGDFVVNEKDKIVNLTEQGVHKVEKFFHIENLADPENLEIQHNITLALRAHNLMHKDQDYVVKDDEILIVDEFTGRIMPGRRYSDGLHQAIEAKEHVKIKRESKTLATITFQNFFNKYDKKILEMAPDIFTSLGILGTFIGLVWGLKSFEPSSYETMTTSVSALVDGIKVAFLTSIYGIAFALIYSSGMKSVYSGMDAKLQGFLERFHLYVLPAAESESRNLMLASQKVQTKAMKQMAEQLTSQMAESFEKAINPTFQKMTESLEILTESVTKCQEDVVQDILRTFLREMNGSFKMQFTDFNEALVQLKEAQKENIDYTTRLYQTMSNQLNTSYAKQSEAMKDLVNELGQVQGRYMSTATRITQDNQEIQKLQQQDYQRIADYLHESEKSSAKFWVACNQTMQKYVEAAAQGMEKVSAANQAGKDVLEANRRLVEQLDAKMKDFVSYQKMTYETMEEVRKLFADISVQKEDNNIYLSGGKAAQSAAQKESTEEIRRLLEEQSERQEALLEEMNKNMKNISKNQKGKFSLFK